MELAQAISKANPRSAAQLWAGLDPRFQASPMQFSETPIHGP